MSRTRGLTIIAVLGIIVLVVVLSMLIWNTTQQVSANGEEELGQLLTTLWDRTLAERASPDDVRSAFSFTIELSDSLSLFGRSITIGTNLNARGIGEAGSDYVCFSQTNTRTGNRRLQCTPFSNIVEVSYRQNP